MTTNPAIRVIVADDEPLVREGIRDFLAAEEDVELVGEADTGAAAWDLLRHCRPDVAFLDIRMPAGSGFDVLSRLEPDQRPEIVFITAFQEFAVQAFEVNAVDYLLKPFDRERLAAAFGRVRRRVLDRRAIAAGGLESLAAARIAVSLGRRRILVALPEIDWIEAAGNYARLHVGDASYPVRRSLVALARRLPSGQFVRVHRATIVNVASVAEVRSTAHGDYDLTLKTGRLLKLSRTYRDGFFRRFRK